VLVPYIKTSFAAKPPIYLTDETFHCQIGGDCMKKREVILGKAISAVVLVTTIIVHNFVFKLPFVFASSLVTFSALLYTLCIIGDERRKNSRTTRGHA